MQYITSIPINSRYFTVSVRAGEFMLSNLEDRADFLWNLAGLDVNKINGYMPLMGSSNCRCFLYYDNTLDRTIAAVETKNAAYTIIGDWREVVQHLRRDLVTLDDASYLITGYSMNYKFGLGNFYLYPELNVFNYTLRQQENKTFRQLTSEGTVVPWSEAIKYLPIDKITRYSQGLLVVAGELYWIDRRIPKCVRLTHLLFENIGALNLEENKIKSEDGVEVQLPYDNGGEWVTAACDPDQINALLDPDALDGLSINHIAGTRITPIKSASLKDCGEYWITGYGTFGRVRINRRVGASLFRRVGNSHGLLIAGRGFEALFNCGDREGLYIRKKKDWIEPIISRPMIDVDETPTDLPDGISADALIETTAPAITSVDSLPTEPTNAPTPTDPAGPVDPTSTVILTIAEPMVIPEVQLEESVVTADIPEVVIPEPSKPETVKIEIKDNVEEIKMADKSNELNNQAIAVPGIFVSSFLEYTPKVTPLWGSSQVLLDLPEPYCNNICWSRNRHHIPRILGALEIEATKNRKGASLFAHATETYIVFDGQVFVAPMHLVMQK